MHPRALAAWRRGTQLLAMGIMAQPSVHARLMRRARGTIARALGAQAHEIWLTSGGTEANALVLEAACARAAALGRPAHIVTSALEHPSISVPLAAASFEGARWHTTCLPTSASGVCLPPARPFAALPDLISIMWANNETGVVQPLAQIMAACAPDLRAAWLHADGVQATGRMPIDFAASGLTFLTVAGHKVGAGGSLGVLVVREGTAFAPPARFRARPDALGTLTLPAGDNLPAALALAEALTAAGEALDDGGARARARDAFEAELQQRCGPIAILGQGASRLPNTSCVRFIGCAAEALLVALDVHNIGVSLGSACSAGVSAPSASVRAMGLDDRAARQVLRISWPMAADAAAWQQAAARLLEVLPPLCRALRG